MEAMERNNEVNEHQDRQPDALSDLSVADAQAATTKGGSVSSGSMQVSLCDGSVKAIR
jgi:hypothetical protein